GLRFEPHVGGRFIEVYDENGEGYEIGRITAWEPGKRLAYTWRQSDWPEDAVTDVQITFEPADGGTRVRMRQTGWERVPGGLDARGIGTDRRHDAGAAIGLGARRNDQTEVRLRLFVRRLDDDEVVERLERQVDAAGVVLLHGYKLPLSGDVSPGDDLGWGRWDRREDTSPASRLQQREDRDRDPTEDDRHRAQLSHRPARLPL